VNDLVQSPDTTQISDILNTSNNEQFESPTKTIDIDITQNSITDQSSPTVSLTYLKQESDNLRQLFEGEIEALENTLVQREEGNTI
jgi:hypothetical protein